MTTSWGRIALLYAIGVLAAGQLGIVPPLVPALQRDLGLSLATAGMTVSIVTLVGAVLGLPAGSWCERIGHGRALAIGILIMATAAALCAAADDASTLLAARGLAGIGYLLVVVAVPLADGRHRRAAPPCLHPVALGHLRARGHRAWRNSQRQDSPTARTGARSSPSTSSCWPSP